MEDFESMFKEIDSNDTAEVSNGNTYNNNNNNGNFNKGNFKKFNNKPIYTNVEGKQTINLWNNDTVIPEPINESTLKTSTKWVTISLPNKIYKLSEEEFKRFILIAKLLRDKNYKVRVVCSNVRPIHKMLTSAFGDDLIRVTAWKGYCKDMKDIKQYLASDKNIKAACHYYKNYQNLPVGVRLVQAAVIGSLVGLDNDELSGLVIVHDRNYNGKMIDFKQSQLASNYYTVAKNLSLNLYNIANDGDFEAVKKILS